MKSAKLGQNVMQNTIATPPPASRTIRISPPPPVRVSTYSDTKTMDVLTSNSVAFVAFVASGVGGSGGGESI